MARFAERENIYEAAESFRDSCLLSSGSLLFGSDQVWTTANLRELRRVFVEDPDTGQRSFLEKFEDQLRNADKSIVRLAAEALSVYFLFPSNVGGSKKFLYNC